MLTFTAIPCFAKNNNILILGDSLSAGYGIDKQQSWVTLLQNKLIAEKQSYIIINASISGETTSNGLLRLPALLKKYHPKIIIIALGGNDGLRGIPISTIKDNLTKMISLAKQQGKVILAGVRLPPNFGKRYTTEFQELFPHLAAQYNVEVVPLLLNNVDNQLELLQTDQIHPNAQAQNIILSNVWPKLEPLL